MDDCQTLQEELETIRNRYSVLRKDSYIARALQALQESIEELEVLQPEETEESHEDDVSEASEEEREEHGYFDEIGAGGDDDGYDEQPEDRDSVDENSSSSDSASSEISESSSSEQEHDEDVITENEQVPEEQIREEPVVQVQGNQQPAQPVQQPKSLWARTTGWIKNKAVDGLATGIVCASRVSKFVYRKVVGPPALMLDPIAFNDESAITRDAILRAPGIARVVFSRNVKKK